MEGFRTCGKRQKKNKWRAENKTRGSRNRVEDSVLVQGKGMRTKMKAWRAGTAKLVKGQNWLIPDHLNIPGLAWHTVSRCIVSVRSFIFQESCSTHHPSFQCHHLSMGLDACGLPPSPPVLTIQPCGILSALHTVISVQTVCPGVPLWKQVCFCLDPMSRFSVS